MLHSDFSFPKEFGIVVDFGQVNGARDEWIVGSVNSALYISAAVLSVWRVDANVLVVSDPLNNLLGRGEIFVPQASSLDSAPLSWSKTPARTPGSVGGSHRSTGEWGASRTPALQLVQMCGINIISFYSSTTYVESGFTLVQALYASMWDSDSPLHHRHIATHSAGLTSSSSNRYHFYHAFVLRIMIIARSQCSPSTRSNDHHSFSGRSPTSHVSKPSHHSRPS